MASPTTETATLAQWVCTALTIAFLLARLLCNWIRKELATASTYLVVISCLVLIARAASDQAYLRYGTIPDLDSKLSVDPSLVVGSDTIAKAVIGTKLSLCARLLVTTFYWLQCSILLLTYRPLLSHITWVLWTMRLCWAVIGITYIAVFLVTLLECRPLSLNWQLTPDPNTCVRAYAQLLTQGVSNVAIDAILLVITIPILQSHTGSWVRNVQLGLLFTLGIFCVIVTCIRCWQTFEEGSYQTTRSLWASVQATVAAFVANASAMYGAIRILRRRCSSQIPDRDPWSESPQLANPTQSPLPDLWNDHKSPFDLEAMHVEDAEERPTAAAAAL